MIKASELRIGNNVQCVGIYKDSFMRAGFITVDAEFILLIESNKILAAPIPLSPDILERCGFKRYQETKFFIKKYSNQGELHMFSGETLVGQANDIPKDYYYFFFNNLAHTINYLHRLQNLHYCLTGEELVIESPVSKI